MEIPSRLATRPLIASMLNNKGVILMEQQQYAAAESSFSRALCAFDRGSNGTNFPRDIESTGIYSHLLKLISPSHNKSTDKSLKYRREYDEGMDHFRTPFRLTLSSKSLDGTILFNLARIAHNQGFLDKALDLYQQSLIALVSIQEDPVIVAILFCIGQIQYIQDNPYESLQTFNMALPLTKSVFGDDSNAVAACNNSIGVLHYCCPNGENDVALNYLLKAISQKQLCGTLLGTVWNNVGRVHFQNGNFDRAIEAYQKALQIRNGSCLDCAATIFNLGQVYHHKNELDKALLLYKQFESLAKQHFGKYHRDICMVNTCIGQLYHEKKDWKSGLLRFETALRVGCAILGPMHPDIAITLNKLGNLYYEKEDYESALDVYHRGLEIELANLTLEDGTANVCVTYSNIAEIYRLTGNFDRAIEAYKELLGFQRKYKSDSLDVARTLQYIGYIHHKNHDYEGALEASQECLRLRRDALGDMHEDVATSLTHLALVLLEMERRDIALCTLTEAYLIRKNSQEPDLRELALTLYNIALIYHKEGDNEKALAFYLETSKVEKAMLGNDHRDLSITAFNIGQIYFHCGQLNHALRSFQEALEIERHCFGANHSTCARTLNEIGNVHLQLGNTHELMECYSEALRIYQKSGISDEQLIVVGQKLWRFELVQPEAAAVA